MENCDEFKKDAMRYRWLKKTIQESYERGIQEKGDNLFYVDTSMLFGRKDVRRMEVKVSFYDTRDEDVNLDEAIDNAMTEKEPVPQT